MQKPGSRFRAVRVVVMAAVLAMVLPALSAWADTISFDLTAPNDAISGFPGPYATVTVNRTSSTVATITFDSLTNGGNIYLLGDGASAAVNVNATSWTLSALTSSNAGTGFTPGPLSDGGSGNVDGFGVFNQTLNSFDGFTHSADHISFTLTNTSATWASASNVLGPNASGLTAAAHIFVTANPANADNGALATGFASVPEPSTLLLAGTYGGVALGWVGRRWRRNRGSGRVS